MAIVANRKGGLSGRGRPARDGGAARWRRAAPWAGAALLLAAVLAWRFMGGATSSLPVPGEPPAPADAATSVPIPGGNVDVAPPEVGSQLEEQESRKSVGDREDAFSVAGEASDASSTPGQQGESGPKPMPYGVLSKQYFDNPVENRLEKLGIPGKGVALSLPNRLSDEEVLEILKRPVEIYDDDDEETVAAKERTAAMKAEALKFIENGGTYDEFVAEMTRVSNEEAALKNGSRQELMRILREDGYEAAEAYLEEANAALRAAGLDEMRIPLPFRRKREKELGLPKGTLQ